MDLEDDLMKALRSSDTNAVLDLLSQGTCLNFLSDDDVGPVHVAVSVRNPLAAANLCQILLAHSADVGLATPEGVTALHWAAGLGRAEIVHLLLAHGADPQARDARGKKPRDYLDECDEGGDIDQVRKLLGGGSYSDVSISFQRYVFDHEQETGGDGDKENRFQHQTPVTKFLDNVQDIFLHDVSGVKNVDDCEGEAAIRQQNDLDELLSELEQVGFKTPTLRRTITVNNNASSYSVNSQTSLQLKVPAQHEITNEEKVQNFLDNMESSPHKSAYHSTPVRIRQNSNVNLQPPDISTSTIHGDSINFQSLDIMGGLDESTFKTPTRSFMKPTQSSQRKSNLGPKQRLFNERTPVKNESNVRNNNVVKDDSKPPVKIVISAMKTPKKDDTKYLLSSPLKTPSRKQATRTPVKMSPSPFKTPKKQDAKTPAISSSPFKTPKKQDVKTPAKFSSSPFKTPKKHDAKTPSKLSSSPFKTPTKKEDARTPLKVSSNAFKTPSKEDHTKTPIKKCPNSPAYHFGTLSSKDSFHTANNSTTSHASIATTLANASLVSVAQEFLYKDDEKGVSLVEVRLPSVLGLALQDQQLLDQLHKASEEATGEKSSVLSCGSSLGSTALREGLKEFGEEPVGPITQATRRAYLLRLKKLRLGLVVPTVDIEAKYPGPMSQSLKNISCVTKKWAELWDLEKQMCAPFSNIDSRTAETVNFLARDAAVKSSFNYLLLDPRLTQNLPSRVFSVGDQELWRVFISAVFYIGKGTRSRPFQHLYEASKKNGKRGKFGMKIDTIHGIWEAGMGVISLQVFQNTIGVEGFTREAAMIQAVGCKNLSNAKPGDWYGPSKDWSQDKQTLLGTFLLFRAFKIFLQEGERQIRPVDLKL